MHSTILRTSKITKLFILSALGIALTGCVSATDKASLTELGGKGVGVVFVGVDFPGLFCLTGENVSVAKLMGDRYVITGHNRKNGWPMKIEAGEHHIVAASCRVRFTRAKAIGLGATPVGLKLSRSKPITSYGTFTVLPGQVTDVGKLVVHISPKDKRIYGGSDRIREVIKVEAAKTSPAELAARKKDFPNLYIKAQPGTLTPKIQTLP